MQMQEFMDKLFERAKVEGLLPCEAYLSAGDSFEASVNRGEIIAYNVSSSLGLGFRALINGKMGYASTQALDEDAIELLIEGAKTNAALIESPDEQFIFAGSKAYPEMTDAFNPVLEQIPATDKIAMVKELEQKTLAQDPRIAQIDECLLMSGSGYTRIVNSMGLDVSHRDNLIGAISVPVARDGEQVNASASYAAVRDVAKLDLDHIAAEAAEETLSGLGAEPVASGQMPIVMRNDTAAALLAAFSAVFSADNAQKGLSLLKGKEGESIAADVVTLMDDPFHPLGLSGAPFDGEGVATFAKPIIENGKLTTLLHNLKTAKKQGLSASTANASRGSYASSISVAPSNFYFAPGSATRDELMAAAEGGLLITDLQGLHAGANVISGDFSLSAKGFVIENGKKGRSVTQITVSGNFYSLLNGIKAVADDLRFSWPGTSCIGSPSILIEGLSVAGA